MRKYSLLALLYLLVCAIAVADIEGRVVAVIDGDTIRVLDGNNVEHRVRLTGIDAPERGQPFGNASRKHLADLVAGRQVRIESDKNDRYGRVLGKVIVDGKDVNLEQVKAGYAWWYRYYANEQPRTDRSAYGTAEESAKAEQTGLWEDPSPINPYDWRKGKRQ